MRSLVLGLLVPILAASCVASMPDSVESPAPVPEAFSATGDRELPAEWWTDFGDPTLDALVMEALAGNLDLRTWWDRVAQFEAVARREGAQRKPALDASAGGELSRVRRPGETTDSTGVGLGLAASYELDFFGRLKAREKAALLDAAASEEDVRAAAISLTALVAGTWYRIVEQRAQLLLLDEQVATNERVLELITLRFRQGQFAAADVLRQRQLTEATRGDRSLAESDLKTEEHLLAVLLGRAPGVGGWDETATFVELPDLPDTGVPAGLVERRPDVRSARLRILAADRRVGEAVADRYPRFSVAGRADTSAEKIGDLFDTWFASLALDALAPLLDAGRRSAEVDRTRAVLSERLNDYGAVILDALREVEDALVRERAQRTWIGSLDRQLELSKSVLDRLRDRYTTGAVSYIDVLQALNSRQSLQRTRLTAARRLIEYRIALCRALAGGWSLDRPAPATIRARAEEESADDPAGS